jgi:hypothetical protein
MTIESPTTSSDQSPAFCGERLVKLWAGAYSAQTPAIPQPRAVAMLRSGAASVTANFQVDYIGFTNEAKAAFQAAVDIWSVMLTTTVPIRVRAEFKPLDPNVLGSAGPTTFSRNFSSAPKSDTWYAIALANKLQKSDLAPGKSHISANFSSVFANWYYGTDGNTPPDKYDFMTVVLHELGHGLGFVGSMDVDRQGIGSWGLQGFPTIYDRFVQNASRQEILNTTLFPNSSRPLGGQLTSNRLFLSGTKIKVANSGRRVQIYAPIVWDPGSSFSHFNEVTFPAGNANSLMTPQFGLGESIQSPGAVGMALLQDLGW